MFLNVELGDSRPMWGGSQELLGPSLIAATFLTFKLKKLWAIQSLVTEVVGPCFLRIKPREWS